MSEPQFFVDYTWMTKDPPQGSAGPWILVAVHTEIDEQLDLGVVKKTTKKVCFFRLKDQPLGHEYPVPSIDCNHTKKEIWR